MITKDKIKSIITKILSDSGYKPYEVYLEFVEFFGEDMVDFQTGNSRSIETFINALELKYTSNEMSDELLMDDIRHALYNEGFSRGAKKILVRWPEVTITNEHDNQVTIKELYARIPIDSTGHMEGSFLLNRADYTFSHLISNYLHSHVREIPTHNFEEFQSCCLGNGPIRSTISTLNSHYDIDKWKLFCLELDRYVHVESLTGGPYHRMTDISSTGSRVVNNPIPFEDNLWNLHLGGLVRRTSSEWDKLDKFLDYILPKFVKFLIDAKVLKFNFSNGGYSIAQSPKENVLDISDAFIDWYNISVASFADFAKQNYDWLIENGILFKVNFTDTWFTYKRIINSGSRYNRFEEYHRAFQGKHVCDFKGNRVTINLYQENTDTESEEDDNSITILNPFIVSFLCNRIVKYVNSKNLSNE